MIPQVSRQHWEPLLSILMRIPGLFILDFWWQHDLTRSWPDHFDWQTIVSTASTDLVMVAGLLLLLLPLTTVTQLYCHVLSFSLIFVSHHFSIHYIEFEMNATEVDFDFIKQQISALLFHVTVASVVAYLLGITSNCQRFLLAMYALPVVAILSGLNSPQILEGCHNFSTAFMIIQGLFYVSSKFPDAVDYYSRFVVVRLRLMLELYGWDGMLVNVWSKLFTPSHFLVFASIQMITFAFQRFHKLKILYDEGWHLVLLSILSNSCYSPISLISGCVFVSYASYLLLLALKVFLKGNLSLTVAQENNIQHSGYTEGLTMMLLAIETGLLRLKNPEKIAVTGVIIFIVTSSLLQSFFEIVEPVILEMAAVMFVDNGRRNRSQQIRALFLCMLLIACPVYMTYQVFYILPLDFWMMIIISSSIMTSIQALNLVVTFVLFVYDSCCEVKPWEELDDVVYYCRSVVRVLEFLVALVIVTAGVIESLSGNWNTLNSAILAVHCYFNVWLRLQSGWKSFLLRREASKKIDSLPLASQSDLTRYGDVCAICYSEMTEARITPCNHLFHGTCLRKWLYMQDKCPMCHTNIDITQTGIAKLDPDNADDIDDLPRAASSIEHRQAVDTR